MPKEDVVQREFNLMYILLFAGCLFAILMAAQYCVDFLCGKTQSQLRAFLHEDLQSQSEFYKISGLGRTLISDGYSAIVEFSCDKPVTIKGFGSSPGNYVPTTNMYFGKPELTRIGTNRYMYTKSVPSAF